MNKMLGQHQFKTNLILRDTHEHLLDETMRLFLIYLSVGLDERLSDLQRLQGQRQSIYQANFIQLCFAWPRQYAFEWFLGYDQDN